MFLLGISIVFDRCLIVMYIRSSTGFFKLQISMLTLLFTCQMLCLTCLVLNGKTSENICKLFMSNLLFLLWQIVALMFPLCPAWNFYHQEYSVASETCNWRNGRCSSPLDTKYKLTVEITSRISIFLNTSQYACLYKLKAIS